MKQSCASIELCIKFLFYVFNSSNNPKLNPNPKYMAWTLTQAANLDQRQPGH